MKRPKGYRFDAPKSVKVLASRYRIIQAEGLRVDFEAAASTVYVQPGVYHEHDALNVLGLADPDAGLIALETEIGDDKFKVTLLHETLHAIFAEAGMKDAIDADLEERIIKRISPILRQVLKDNPRVYSFVTGRQAW